MTELTFNAFFEAHGRAYGFIQREAVPDERQQSVYSASFAIMVGALENNKQTRIQLNEYIKAGEEVIFDQPAIAALTEIAAAIEENKSLPFSDVMALLLMKRAATPAQAKPTPAAAIREAVDGSADAAKPKGENVPPGVPLG